MGERPAKSAAAFITPGLGGSPAKVPALIGIVLKAPTRSAQAFGVNVLRLSTPLTHSPAERVEALTVVRIADFTISHQRAVNHEVSGALCQQSFSRPTNRKR